jgi:hypothetical protein
VTTDTTIQGSQNTAPLTAEQARSFDRTSAVSAETLAAAAAVRGCDCRAYRDWFTYRRWSAQGEQVQKGEKGTRLTTYGETEKEDPKTGAVKTETRPFKTYVFCRCQVAPREAKP